MTQPLRLIHLEGNQADAELIDSTLRNAGILCHAKRVHTREDFLAALRQGDSASSSPTRQYRNSTERRPSTSPEPFIPTCPFYSCPACKAKNSRSI